MSKGKTLMQGSHATLLQKKETGGNKAEPTTNANFLHGRESQMSGPSYVACSFLAGLCETTHWQPPFRDTAFLSEDSLLNSQRNNPLPLSHSELSPLLSQFSASSFPGDKVAVAQASLEFLGSRETPALPLTGTAGVHHHAQLRADASFTVRWTLSWLLFPSVLLDPAFMALRLLRQICRNNFAKLIGEVIQSSIHWLYNTHVYIYTFSTFPVYVDSVCVLILYIYSQLKKKAMVPY